MRIAEDFRSEWLGRCKRILRAEASISEGLMKVSFGSLPDTAPAPPRSAQNQKEDIAASTIAVRYEPQTDIKPIRTGAKRTCRSRFGAARSDERSF